MSGVTVMSRLLGRSVVNGDCTLWTGAIHDRDGYGLIKVDGKVKKVHRVAWEIENGPIPEGEKVRHTCPNRNCWNVRHLVLGDLPEPEAPRLSVAEVDEDEEGMRALYNEGHSLRYIADEYSLSVTTVRLLAKNWAQS